MKYYAFGNKIALVKKDYSDSFFDNLPIVGTPIFSRLPITEEKIVAAYNNSPNLILFKTIEEAK